VSLAPDPWPAPAVRSLCLDNSWCLRRRHGMSVGRGCVAAWLAIARTCVRVCVCTCVNSPPTTTTKQQIGKCILDLITDSNRIVN